MREEEGGEATGTADEAGVDAAILEEEEGGGLLGMR